MNIDTNLISQKLELIQWLSTIEDEAILESLMVLKNKENTNWWNSMSEIELNSIEKGIKDAKSKKLNSHSTVRKRYEKWL